MILNQIFELSMILDADHFREALTIAFSKSDQLQEIEEGYIDLSLAPKGITVIYRDSQYKKKVRVLVNASLVVDDISDSSKLIRKLDKHIAEYFEHKYRLDNFALSGTNFVVDINVGNRVNAANYLKVLHRVGKVKGFSPVSYEYFDDKMSFCLSGNSNGIDFLLYDLERAVIGQLRSADAGRKKIESVSMQTRGILRAEVRLTKPKAIRAYTDTDNVCGQIVELIKDRQQIFLDTFARVVPFGDFHKKDTAMEIIRREVSDNIMRRRMLRLLVLIPEKKSLHLAQKEMNCRNLEKVMETFTQIGLSPVTISKRHDLKHLDNLYSYFL